MSTKIVVGVDGADSGDRALVFAKDLAGRTEDCELIIAYVIEWSPFSFHTAEENEMRHKRREEELETAHSRIVDPAVSALQAAGFNAKGIVRHGDVAETLNAIGIEESASQLVVARRSESGFAKRIFGSSTQNLVMHADVPVTVVA